MPHRGLGLGLVIALLTQAPPGIAAQSTAADGARVTIHVDGWSLAGTFVAPATGGRAPAVLLLNGAARDRRAYIALAGELAARGIASLRLDLRGEGESTNLGRFEPGQTNARLEGADADIVAALAWMRADPRIDGSRIGVLGASYSGELMAAAARAGAGAQAYVALSPGSFSDTSARAIDASGVAWWFIASKDERFAQTVVERIPSMSTSARVTIVDGNAHASDILSPHFLLNGEIADWFAAALRRFETPALWGRLTHGAHPVGFRTLRHATAGGALRIDLWYPAADDDGEPMTFASCLAESDDLRGAVDGFPRAPGSLAATLDIAISGAAGSVPAATLERMLASRMAARRDVAAAPIGAPLVLWTPRYATTAMQAVMSEFLASHGFAVAFVRRDGTSARMPFELETPAAKRAERDARVDDMRAAADALAREPSIDARHIAVLAWSYTGEMATAFQQRDARVALVAGLSTTLLDNWVFADAAELATLDPARLSATYAVLTEPRDATPALLDRLSPSYLVEFPGTSHGSFNALEGHLPALFGVTTVQRWSRAGDASARGYEAAATVVLRLLRHHARPGARPLRASMLAAGLESRVRIRTR